MDHVGLISLGMIRWRSSSLQSSLALSSLILSSFNRGLAGRNTARFFGVCREGGEGGEEVGI